MNHPEVDWIESTGYPSYAQEKIILCDECGRELNNETVYEDETHTNLCESCLLMLHEKDW